MALTEKLNRVAQSEDTVIGYLPKSSVYYRWMEEATSTILIMQAQIRVLRDDVLELNLRLEEVENGIRGSDQ
jgi:hypothetical protein